MMGFSNYVFLILISLTFSRIPPQKRKFNDSCLEQVISSYEPLLSSKLYEIFVNAFPNTLDTTIQAFDESQPLTYIITGDIPAMWLRDSTNQIIPYIRIKRTCERIKTLVLGLINMQAKLIMIDPYTNAFCQNYTGKARPFYLNDNTWKRIMGIDVDLARNMEFATKSIWERKYQIDSLASFFRLIYEYHNRYNTTEFLSINTIKAIKLILKVIERESQDNSYEYIHGISYKFKRDMKELPQTVMRPSSRIGLVRSGFRPSDDAMTLPYNIPGNAMLSTYLFKVASILKSIDTPFYKQIIHGIPAIMERYAQRINQSIYQYGMTQHKGNIIFAYQVNGKGMKLKDEDPNLPSLLALPYMEFVQKNSLIYINTRKYILSPDNPRYFVGSRPYMKGLGSSHTDFGTIWPIAVITQALTSDNIEEIKSCINFLKETSLHNFIHESVHKDNLQSITREWFAWANSYFGELIIYLVEKHPSLVK